MSDSSCSPALLHQVLNCFFADGEVYRFLHLADSLGELLPSSLEPRIIGPASLLLWSKILGSAREISECRLFESLLFVGCLGAT